MERATFAKGNLWRETIVQKHVTSKNIYEQYKHIRDENTMTILGIHLVNPYNNNEMEIRFETMLQTELVSGNVKRVRYLSKSLAQF